MECLVMLSGVQLAVTAMLMGRLCEGQQSAMDVPWAAMVVPWFAMGVPWVCVWVRHEGAMGHNAGAICTKIAPMIKP